MEPAGLVRVRRPPWPIVSAADGSVEPRACCVLAAIMPSTSRSRSRSKRDASSPARAPAGEPIMGYSRAVRTGGTITVTGTVGSTPTARTPRRWASRRGAHSPSSVRPSRRSAGDRARRSGTPHVRHRRIMLEEVWRYTATCSATCAATTIVEVARLIDGDARIEIEADGHPPGVAHEAGACRRSGGIGHRRTRSIVILSIRILHRSAPGGSRSSWPPARDRLGSAGLRRLYLGRS